MLLALSIVALIVLVLLAVIRLKKIDVARYHQRPIAQPLGSYPADGGFQTVVAAADPQMQQLARISAAILDTPGTVGLGGSLEDRHLSFVTRSRFWGFPDITNVTLENGTLNISSHLVFGRKDFGVNEARIKTWLSALGQG